MAVAVCGDDAGDVSAGVGGVWGVGGGGEGCARVRHQGGLFSSRGLSRLISSTGWVVYDTLTDAVIFHEAESGLLICNSNRCAME